MRDQISRARHPRLIHQTPTGTMGTDAARRALVRFPGGRIEQVRVGDTLRGNRIDAIEPERLRMSRAGRQSVLDMPQG